MPTDINPPSTDDSDSAERNIHGDREPSVLLDRFSEYQDGEYECRISTLRGDSLFSGIVRSNISLEVLEVLQKAIKPSIRRQPMSLCRSKFTVSRSLGFNQDVKNFESEHNACIKTLDLCVRILVPNARGMSGSIGLSRSDILDICAPESMPKMTNSWSSRDFYDNIHGPSSKNVVSKLPVVEDLECKLYPFQERAVQWLLWREGAEGAQDPREESLELPHGFIRTIDGDGRPCLVSYFWGIATTDERVPQGICYEPRGGILAEEMGLGKTVEMIAVLCLNKRNLSGKEISLDDSPQSSATLIITPPSILQQWRNELQTLAPCLKVLLYEGLRFEAGRGDHEALLSRCKQQDVVLTTYNVLAKEVYYAETPDRGLRHEKRYEKRLSPLTQLLWWRVILDEAQMVESGVSNVRFSRVTSSNVVNA